MSSTKKKTLGRRLKKQRKLWHDRALNSCCLGCINCPDFAVCGGLNVAAQVFDCLSYCCGNPDDCDVVCRNNSASFVDRVREIGSFDFSTIPRAVALPTIPLPSVIPMFYHRGNRHEPYQGAAAALPLYELLIRDTAVPKFGSNESLRRYFGIADDVPIVLSGTAADPPLERWWALGEQRQQAICALQQMGIALTTTPNFSVFSNQPRWDDLHSMKRIAIVWQEFVSGGIPTALHLNARTDTDWLRWTTFVSERSEITHLAFEFATGAGWRTRCGWHVEKLCTLARIVQRPLAIIVRGGTSYLQELTSAFHRVHVLETSIFIKTMQRQLARLSDGVMVWEEAHTLPGEPLDGLLKANCRVVNAHLESVAHPKTA